MLERMLRLVTASHQRFDKELPTLLAASRERGARLYCTAGCSSCCTLYVQATLAEAVVIAAQLGPVQWTAVENYLVRLRSIMAQSLPPKEFLRRHRSEAGPCPFLNTAGQCEIYPHRPLACRSLYSTRNSAWCGVDFGELHPAERQAFMSSLDQSLVAYPTHYLAAPQDLARELELELEATVLATSGYSMSGNLPLLVFLCAELAIGEAILPPLPRLREFLSKEGWDHPWIYRLTT